GRALPHPRRRLLAADAVVDEALARFALEALLGRGAPALLGGGARPRIAQAFAHVFLARFALEALLLRLRAALAHARLRLARRLGGEGALPAEQQQGDRYDGEVVHVGSLVDGLRACLDGDPG